MKNFSDKYNLPLEVPCNKAIIDYLEPMGYDFSNDSIEYVLKYSSFKDNFSEDFQTLQDLDRSRSLLKSLSISKNVVVPIINIFGSITSRIYYKDPLFQNLSKKHRDIIKPKNSSRKLSYIDYDQFEVGIMAALSQDLILIDLYNQKDVYLHLSKTLFNSESSEDRKFTKNLFLAFSYGMSSKRIGDAVHERGGKRKLILDFFKSLDTFNKWKVDMQNKFFLDGKIGTCLGNYLIRNDENPEIKNELSKKEERSCISQIVQGTASLIFKKALIKLDEEKNVRILVTMHDAVLVEHSLQYDINKIINIFEKTMTNHFDGLIKGKASVDKFFSDE